MEEENKIAEATVNTAVEAKAEEAPAAAAEPVQE